MPDDSQHGTGFTPGSAMEGRYANYFHVGHNAIEFLFDFGQLYEEGEHELFHTRVVTSAPYAKEFLKVLSESIEQYERTFGPIKQPE
jgi:hypothetical protein